MDTLPVYLLIFLHILYSVECLNCLQCSSLSDTGCSKGSVEPKPCYNESFIYCLKYETKDDKVKFVTRDCSDVMVSGCNTVSVREKRVTVCRETCTQDGCNSATTFTSHSTSDISRLLTCALAAVTVINL